MPSETNKFLIQWRYVHLFFTLMLVLACVPFLANDFLRNIVLDLTFAIVVGSAFFCLWDNKVLAGLVLVLYAGGQVTEWIAPLWFGDTRIGQNFLNVVWFGVVAGGILRDIFSRSQITKDIVFGGLCMYIIIGLAWAELYRIIEYFNPNSFLIAGEPASIPGYSLTYFSFVTLTTLGYGDVLPLTDKARALAIVESVGGQLFLAVMISRLVSGFVSDAKERKNA